LGKINQDQATGDGFYNVGTTVLGVPLNRDFGGVYTLQSFWFMKSDHLGKLSVGKQSQASDNTALLVDGSGSLVPANYVQFDYAGFGTSAGVPWIALTGCTDCNGIPLNSVRYDSPVFGGFSVSASWGEDDFWDVAARYAGEHAGFKVAVAAAYSESTDAADTLDVGGGVIIPNPEPDGAFVQADNTQFFQIGGYVQHVPTGLFAYGAYGQLELDDDGGVGSDELNDFFYVKLGLRERWTPLGHTVLYGEYENFDNDAADAEVDLWGAGIVQEIDAAAMSVWLTYRHLEGDVAGVDVDEFQYVKAGALINF
jgi:predicted porin